MAKARSTSSAHDPFAPGYNPVCGNCAIIAGCVDLDEESPTAPHWRNDDGSVKCQCGNVALYEIEETDDA